MNILLWYSLHTGIRWCLGQRHGLQSTTLTSLFYKNIYWKVIYVYDWKYFSRQIYWYNLHISKLNGLKVIHDLYSQCLTQTLSKTSSYCNAEGVQPYLGYGGSTPLDKDIFMIQVLQVFIYKARVWSNQHLTCESPPSRFGTPALLSSWISLNFELILFVMLPR
jgi:hypothetical protein